MSIRIDKKMCCACGKCAGVCPGGLIYCDKDNKAFIRYPEECWGCTACIKECGAGAIRYFLGADIGGNGACLYTKQEKGLLHWFVLKANGEEEKITINREESNRY